METFATTLGAYTQFENLTETTRNKEYYGVFVKVSKTETAETKNGFKLLGYFETFANANQFASFLNSEKGLEPTIMKYNPAQNA